MGGYVFQPYPKCKYHPDGRVLVVANAGEELALDPNWSDTIAPPAPPPEDALVASSTSASPSASPPLDPPITPPAPTPDPPRRRRGRPRKATEAP